MSHSGSAGRTRRERRDPVERLRTQQRYPRQPDHRAARRTLDDPVIGNIAKAPDKSPAHVMLRWGLQHGRSIIPKSTKPTRIAENINVFDSELAADEMAAIDGLDTGHRGGPEPDAITLEAFGRAISGPV
jgi:diketogulonate reductase-like aldo/keto reductase